jgi:hypothetical protein
MSLVVAGVARLFSGSAMAQNPVEVDAQHHKVAFESDRVRVLHVQYGPHEQSVIHHQGKAGATK